MFEFESMQASKQAGGRSRKEKKRLNKRALFAAIANRELLEEKSKIYWLKGTPNLSINRSSHS